jgi:uncharacterized surface protein with fasciclin (FAS1) repeats
MTEKLSLIETIENTDMFSVFSRLMRTTHVDEIFGGEGGFTVFVPTNDAFGKIGDVQMDALLNQTSHEILKNLLSYHVVPGILLSASLPELRTAVAVNGGELKFTSVGSLKVNNSGIQARNIEAANGVIHAIDTVLAPPIRAVASSSIL